MTSTSSTTQPVTGTEPLTADPSVGVSTTPAGGAPADVIRIHACTYCGELSKVFELEVLRMRSVVSPVPIAK